MVMNLNNVVSNVTSEIDYNVEVLWRSKVEVCCLDIYIYIYRCTHFMYDMKHVVSAR